VLEQNLLSLWEGGVRDEDIKDFRAFLDEFQSETDRGAALVGAALIDKKLLDTLRAFMVEGNVSEGLLEGGNAALGAFAARIKAAFALGLIDRHEYDECNLIRKIRNEFAHRVHGTSFKQPEIAKLCDKLQSDLPGGRGKFKDKPRHMYINAVVLTIMRFTYRNEWVAKEKRHTKNWP
jgi:hypothetical protein